MDDVMEMEATDLSEVEAPEQDDAPDSDMPPEGEEESAEEPEESEEESEEEGEEETPEEEAKPAEVAVNGRNMPDAVKKLLALGKTSNPEGTKIMRGVWFQNQDYKSVFPTPADAIALKTQFEEIGGADGVAQIQNERQEWAEIDKAVGEGRAADLLKDNPELLGKNAVGVVNEWAKAAPDQYAYYTDKVTTNKLDAMGMQSGLKQLHDYLKKSDADAANFVAGLHDKIMDIREKAEQYETKRVDPKQEQLDRKIAEFEDQRRADFEGKVANDAETYLKGAVDKAITGLLNGRTADPAMMEIYREKVTAEVQKRLGEIPGFANNLEAHYRTGDQAKSAGWVKQQYDRILSTGKAASVIDPLLRNINPQKAAVKSVAGRPAARASTEPGSVVMRDWPDHSQVDWNRTTSADVAQGRAILTNGKKASGWV